MTEQELRACFGAEVGLPPVVKQKLNVAYRQTRAEGRGGTPRKRLHRSVRTLVVLAAVIAALCVSAAAVYLVNHGAVFEAFFGNESRPSIQAETEFSVNEERVPVNSEQAEALVGNYLAGEPHSWTIGDYTLTVEEYFLDEVTGTGKIYYTLERPGGVVGLTVSPEDGEVWTNGEGIYVNFCVLKEDGKWWPVGERTYLDPVRTTADKLCMVLSLAEEDIWNAADGLTIEFGDLRLNKNSGTTLDLSLLETFTLPGTESLPTVSAYNDTETRKAALSASGIKIYSPEVEQGHPIRYLALHYADGAEYVVIDDEKNIRNSAYELGSGNKGGYFTYDPETQTMVEHPPTEVREETVQYCFNRLVDPSQVVSITVDGHVYAIK